MRLQGLFMSITFLLGFLCQLPLALSFDTPLYINMGGPEVVDSLGRTWLGDGAGADPLDIRPNDAGGSNVIPAWCNPSPDSVTALGFDGNDPADVSLFRSIRYDTGANGVPYILELPVEAGVYDVTLYFCEECCPARHAKILMQGQTVFADVHIGTFAGGATRISGSLTAEDVYVGRSEILNITLLGCGEPECPGGTDLNPILNALAVEPGDGDPCAGEARICPFNLSCSLDEEGAVTGSWDGPLCFELSGYELYVNDTLVDTLAADAVSFSVPQTERNAVYRLVPLVEAGDPCAELTCSVFNPDASFETPLYINMGGAEVVDSLGRTWLGDGVGADPLNIRPNDVGGANVIPVWCNPLAAPDALTDLGFDPGNPSDVAIFQSIRWDLAGDGVDYVLEFLVEPGFYDLGFYFCEAGATPGRHYKISVQGQVALDDVSSALFAGGAGSTAGLLTVENVYVGSSRRLNIALIGCPECPGATDPNPILNGLSINETEGDPCQDGVVVCPFNFSCTLDEEDNTVTGTWEGPACVEATGYEVYQNGNLVATPAAGENSFTVPQEVRNADYRLVPMVGDNECPELTCSMLNPAIIIETPVYFNMGGPEITDSFGRVWRDDSGVGMDVNNIRPDDLGGSNVVGAGNWCDPLAAAVAAVGFTPGTADREILRSIRWDPGGDGIPFVMEIPLEPGSYTIRMYMCENCCPQRHFNVFMQELLVFADVSNGSYAGGLFDVPGLLEAREVIVGDDQILNITLLGCPEPECPGGTSGDAILSALAILPSDYDECSNPLFETCAGGLSPKNLTCALDAETGTVTGTWDSPACADSVESYDVLKNGELLVNLAANATEFTDTLDVRTAFYEVVPNMAPDLEVCAPLSCTVTLETLEFAIPLRINMAGETLRDSGGTLWLGDRAGPGDFLSIRPDDAGGSMTNVNWCIGASQANADSLGSLGFDAFDPDDQAIFNTLRWDVGDDDTDGSIGELNDPNGGDVDFTLELPVPDGDYLVNLYLTECCCERHFIVEIEGEVVDGDVNPRSGSLSGEYGRTRRLSFDDVAVADGGLSLALRPCPDCPVVPPDALLDSNPMLNALEVLPAGTSLSRCPHDLVLTLNEDDSVTGTWIPGENVTVSGYELYLNGTKVADLPGNATEFTQDPGCVRIQRYELVPISDDPEFLCPDLRMATMISNFRCDFETPVRINMGGPELVDSLGRIWLGDGTGADPLEIRPDDAGGANVIPAWCDPNPDSVTALGFDGTNPADVDLFRSIRYDTGADAVPYILELPVELGVYDVTLYLCEACCPQRHARILMQDQTVFEDVHSGSYAGGLLQTPGSLMAEGVLVGESGTLSITLLPCLEPDCPGGTDANPILSALEVVRTSDLPNNAPTAIIDASAKEVELLAGQAEITLDGSKSDDGDEGAQGLTYQWTLTDSGGAGDAAVEIVSPTEAITVVTFTAAGTFTFELLVDDGEPIVNTATASIVITVLPQSAPIFPRGDANGDGDVNISDASFGLNWLFLGGPDPVCQDAADSNDDGAVNISDASYTLNFLFLGGPNPPDPGPNACGIDPSEDTLPECEHPEDTCPEPAAE